MSRTDGNRITVIVLAIWILIAAFAAAALAQQHTAGASSLSNDRRDVVESDRNQAGGPCSIAVPGTIVMTVGLGTLPSLDAIGARTNVAAFMQNSVPAELQVAALRRAWLMDPAIRDYKGLQENDWDFEVSGSIPGFGELDPSVDVQSMLSGLFSEPPRLAARTPVLSRAIYDPIALFLASLIQRPGQGFAP